MGVFKPSEKREIHTDAISCVRGVSIPYIKDNRRGAARWAPENAGELNFAITRLIQVYLGDGPNYQRYNDALGAIEGAKLELYARKVRPYEDSKIAENGDVY